MFYFNDIIVHLIFLFTYHGIHVDESGRTGSEQSEENEVTVMMFGHPTTFYTQFSWSVLK